jgi:cyclopropane fatty-acyl-phospholipid synthase-like methyltransferase
MTDRNEEVLERELEYHERLYSGFAQTHFARAAVRALRQHMVRRILRITGAGATSRVLSVGCGIGDTELLLAPYVGEVVGVDLSPSAIRQAQEDAKRLGVANARFIKGTIADVHGESFNAAVAIFFLHHLSGAALDQFPADMAAIIKPGGVFYSLDPSDQRLSGKIGRLLFPKLMKKYQTADERELNSASTAGLFVKHWKEVRSDTYDFVSSPLAGLLPGWRTGYRLARRIDDLLLNLPLFRATGSNFEIIAKA